MQGRNRNMKNNELNNDFGKIFEIYNISNNKNSVSPANATPLLDLHANKLPGSEAAELSCFHWFETVLRILI